MNAAHTFRFPRVTEIVAAPPSPAPAAGGH
jgi:hypothetical protein